MKRILMVMFALLIAVPVMAVPANPTLTTTSGALTAASTQVTLASGTGVTAASGSIINTYLIINDEMVGVQAAQPAGQTVTWKITRGVRSQAAAHASGEVVAVVAPNQVFDNFLRGGCTASVQAFWPRIVVSAGLRGTKSIYYEICMDDNWVETKSMSDSGLGRAGEPQIFNVPVGSVALASVGTSTTCVTGTTFYTSFYVPYTQKWTGIKVLQNGTVGTNNLLGVLYDADGNVLVNTPAAGVITVGANTFLALPFTTPVIIPGAAWYHVGIQCNGNTDGLRTVATATYLNIYGSSATGTFATIPAITPPTSLAADKAPIVGFYQ